jgi:hypothetical protein
LRVIVDDDSSYHLAVMPVHHPCLASVHSESVPGEELSETKNDLSALSPR